MSRKGAVEITPPSIPDPMILTRALMLQLLQVAARIGAGQVGDEEVSDVSISKLVAGVLSGDKVMQFSGAGVILKSSNFQKDERRFTAPLISNLSKTLPVPTGNFTSADVGRSITGTGLADGTTIASVTSSTQVELSAFPGAPAINVRLYMPDRPVGAGWALYGDGTMEVNAGGIFRGLIELAGFAIAADGTVTIGAGTSKMSANPDGSFTWGSGGAIVGITPDGKFFAGGVDYASAVFSVNNKGDILLRETAQSLHTIPPGAIDWSAILSPTFDPPGGAFTVAVDVGILCQTPRVKIYYTTDGTDPTSSSTLYTGTRIHLTATTTVKAIAYIGPFMSAVASQTFTLDSAVVPNPQVDPVGGDYSPNGGILTVNLSDTLAGASIRYTTDGTTVPSDTVGTLISPDNSHTPPAASIYLTSTTGTLKMIAYKAGKTNSGVVTEVYAITNGGSGSGGGGGGGRGNVP